MRKIWELHNKWITLAAALMMVALAAVIAAAAATPAPRTQAEPPAESDVTFDMEKNRAYTAEDGIVVIPASHITDDIPAVIPLAVSVVTDKPEDAWKEGEAIISRGYTLPELAQMTDGSIGLLTIPKLGLTVSVFETEDEMEAMTKGLAHFKTTSAWDGNIGLCGHNLNFDLTDGYFMYLHTLKEGDAIAYNTALGQRSYTVTAVKEIADDDWSWLGRTEENKITLVTCISGKPSARLVVQAVQL